MTTASGNRQPNKLWLARKNANLAQKQVAFLLGNKTIDQISRYENSACLPQLETALKLEIIYGVPIRLLFADLSQLLKDEIADRAAQNAVLKGNLRQIFGDGLCPYAEILCAPSLSRDEFTKATAHSIQMVNRVSRRAGEFEADEE